MTEGHAAGGRAPDPREAVCADGEAGTAWPTAPEAAPGSASGSQDAGARGLVRGTGPGPGYGPGFDPDSPDDSEFDSDPEFDGEPPGPHSRLRRTLVALVAVAGLVLATSSVVGALVRDGSADRPRAVTAPAAGDVRIRVIGPDLCLNERRGGRSGQIHQRPCEGADVPRYSLEERGPGTWRIVSDHPDHGPGCSGIPAGGRIPDAAFEDSECGDPSRVETFRLEPFGSPVTGYRIVPVRSAAPDSCVSVVGDRAVAWAKLAQAPCRADGGGQLFSFDRR
ncbi:RICIN domain-containing protein [Streptomyces sp. NPDC090127]|uniref:RICIN domain-containing protein n=1 Tax=Streptomyces sp. NPDC090127 TaxID=3365953 RepID=UPI0037F47E97